MLITGGAGFIGSHLADRLLEAGDEVWALDDLSTGSLDNVAHLSDRRDFHLVVDSVLSPAVVNELVHKCDLVYHLAPAVRQRWYWLTPGSVFAGVVWAAVSLGLRAYVSHFANYNATYGSIGGVILLLLWLYLSGMALLVGGEINSVIARAAAERGEEVAAPLDEPDVAPT